MTGTGVSRERFFQKDIRGKLKENTVKVKIITLLRIFYCNAIERGSRIKICFLRNYSALFQNSEEFLKNFDFAE